MIIEFEFCAKTPSEKEKVLNILKGYTYPALEKEKQLVIDKIKKIERKKRGVCLTLPFSLTDVKNSKGGIKILETLMSSGLSYSCHKEKTSWFSNKRWIK